MLNQNDSLSANCITRGVKPRLVAVIWPNAPALVGIPAGLRLTVQLKWRRLEGRNSACW